MSAFNDLRIEGIVQREEKLYRAWKMLTEEGGELDIGHDYRVEFYTFTIDYSWYTVSYSYRPAEGTLFMALPSWKQILFKQNPFYAVQSQTLIYKNVEVAAARALLHFYLSYKDYDEVAIAKYDKIVKDYYSSR